MPPKWIHKISGYLAIFLIVLLIGTYFRAYPLRTHHQRDSRGKATLLVISRLKAQVDQQIERGYPQASDKQKTALKAQALKDLMRQEDDKVQASIAKVQRNIDGHNGHGTARQTPYLLASDSFHFYQLTEHLIQSGQLSSTIQGSKYLNELMLAPKGHYEPLTLHPHVGAFVYRLIRLWRSDIDLMEALGYTPLILSALALMAFLITCFLMRSSLWSTFIGSILFMCSPIFIKRSAWGWYDNDPYNALFPLLIIGVLFATLNHHMSRKRLIGLQLLLATLMLSYAYFWQGWMLMFVVALSGLALAAAYSRFVTHNGQNAKRESILIGGVAGFTFLLIGVCFGPKEFFLLFQEGYKAMKNFLVPQLSIWPDLYISVGELHQANLFEVIVLTGGFIFFGIALTGLFCSLLGWGQEAKSRQVKIALILTVFLGMTIVITLGAQRFALLCLTPVALLFVTGLNHIQFYGDRLLQNITSTGKRRAAWLGLRCLLLATAINPLLTVHRQMPKLLNPIYNDTWHAALTDIAADTPQNSIINTWWPPGHFIKATAGRRVTFDGATINYPQAYWLTRVYLGQSEQEALGLLRMLNHSANDAAEYLTELGFKTSSAVAIIRTITALNNRQARLLLGTKIQEKNQVDHLLELTHSRSPPSYLFIYRDLVDKNIQLAFIGNWNFQKIEEINADPQLMAKVPDRNSKEYVQFLWTLAGGPYKYHAPLAEIARQNEWILFEKGIKINAQTKMCIVDSAEFGRGIPQSIFFVRDGQVVEQRFENSSLSYSVTVFEKGDRQHAVLMDRYLANSMIMRLYYFGDRGMRYVKNFTERADLSRQTDIRVFEIDWEAFQRDHQ